jgi:nitronate monooxygenase
VDADELLAAVAHLHHATCPSRASRASRRRPGAARLGQGGRAGAEVEDAGHGLLAASGLQPLHLAGRRLLPIVQGGMGVGVSAHRLAGSVAALGGVGTLVSSVDLRRHHPDLMARTQHLPQRVGRRRHPCGRSTPPTWRRGPRGRARAGIAGGRGLVAMNVMRAVSDYAAYVRASLEAGVRHGGGGRRPAAGPARPGAATTRRPADPILSDARGVQLIVKKWERKKRLPDAIVIEHPRLAGGHLGAAKIADLNDPRFDFERVIPQSLAFLRSAGHGGACR